MKIKIKKYLKEALVFGVLFFILSGALSFYRTGTMRIDDSVCERGVDIVYFWATWCPVCKMTSPNIERVSKHFAVLGVAVRSEDNGRVDAYMESHHLHFQNINDFDAARAKKYDINVFPTVVFCKNGHVKMAEVGYITTVGLWLRAWIVSLRK